MMLQRRDSQAVIKAVRSIKTQEKRQNLWVAHTKEAKLAHLKEALRPPKRDIKNSHEPTIKI